MAVVSLMDRLARLGSRGARLTLLATVALVMAALAAALAAFGVDDVEIVATLLVLPVFGVGLYAGLVPGLVAAMVATGVYGILRQPDLDGAGAVGLAVLAVSRALAYGVVAYVGARIRRFIDALSPSAERAATPLEVEAAVSDWRLGASGPVAATTAAPVPAPASPEVAGGWAYGAPYDATERFDQPLADEAAFDDSYGPWAPGPGEPADGPFDGGPHGPWAPGPGQPADQPWDEAPAAAASWAQHGDQVVWENVPPTGEGWPEPVQMQGWSGAVSGGETWVEPDPAQGAWPEPVQTHGEWPEADRRRAGTSGRQWPAPQSADDRWPEHSPGDAGWPDPAAQGGWPEPHRLPEGWQEADGRHQGWAEPPSADGEWPEPAQLHSDWMQAEAGPISPPTGWREPTPAPGYPAAGGPWGPEVPSPTDQRAWPDGAAAVARSLPAVDPETQLASARYLCDRLAFEQSRAAQRNASYSLVLVQVPDEPLAGLSYRRQIALLRELGRQFVAGGLVDHLVHVPDQVQHWFAAVLPDTDRFSAQVVERQLRDGIGGYLRSRGLALRQLDSACLTTPDDGPAMDAFLEALIQRGDPSAEHALA